MKYAITSSIDKPISSGMLLSELKKQHDVVSNRAKALKEAEWLNTHA